MNNMKRLIITACATILCGCAYMKSNTHSITRNEIISGTNNVQVVEQDTHARAFTFFDANSQLQKFRNGSGETTYSSNSISAGTWASGINESSSTTNLAANINAVNSLLMTIGALSAK